DVRFVHVALAAVGELDPAEAVAARARVDADLGASIHVAHQLRVPVGARVELGAGGYDRRDLGSGTRLALRGCHLAWRGGGRGARASERRSEGRGRKESHAEPPIGSADLPPTTPLDAE